jgi:hypothetical protein
LGRATAPQGGMRMKIEKAYHARPEQTIRCDEDVIMKLTETIRVEEMTVRLRQSQLGNVWC